jgi:hypothetical protein
MHAENYGAIWKYEWINFASSLTQDMYNEKSIASYSLDTLRGYFMCLFILKAFSDSDIVYFGEMKHWRWSVVTSP